MEGVRGERWEVGEWERCGETSTNNRIKYTSQDRVVISLYVQYYARYKI